MLQNVAHVLIVFVKYIVYFSAFTSHKILFSCIKVHLVCHVLKLFSKIKLVKTQLCVQLKQTNLKSQLYVSTESQKEGFNETVFQNFVDELKHQFQYFFLFMFNKCGCYVPIQNDLFFITCFALFLFLFFISNYKCKSFIIKCLLLYY